MGDIVCEGTFFSACEPVYLACLNCDNKIILLMQLS